MSIKTTLGNGKSQQQFKLRQVAILTGENIHEFTGGNDEVVLLFQSAPKMLYSVVVTQTLICDLN